MDLLLISNEKNLIICTLKILTDLCLVKQKAKLKNTFAKTSYSVLLTRMY